MDQPCKVTSPARGQLNRENEYFPVPVRARDFGLTRQVRPSRPASACSFSTLRLNLVLTYYGILPAFRGGVHFFYLNHHTPSGQSRVYRVTQLRTDGVHCRESAGTVSVILKVVVKRVLPFQVSRQNQPMCASLFPHPRLLVVCCSVHDMMMLMYDMHKVSEASIASSVYHCLSSRACTG